MSGLAWHQGTSKESLESFLERNPPSKTYAPKGGDGWIWVKSDRDRDVESGSSKSIEDARKVLDDLVERYEEVENNPKIPKVKSKISGPSKKMVKESAQRQAEQQLRDIGKEWPCGKWLFFERVNFVDYVFSTLAKSIIDGPLSKLPNANCHTIKVATADSLVGESSSRGREPTHLICLYFDVIWNAQHANEVLETVVKEHAQLPNSAKADLYTVCGLDSNHPSKLRSTLYRPAEMFNADQLKEWQAESRAQSKRKAEEAREGGEGSKKRLLTNGSVVPIRPEDFWPGSQNNEDDFENSKDQAVIRASSTEAMNDGSKEGNNSIKTSTTLENIVNAGAEEDSETEDDEVISLKPSSKKTSSPAKADSVKSTGPDKKEALKTTSPAIRQTIFLPSTSTNKKRDRFGRSDF